MCVQIFHYWLLVFQLSIKTILVLQPIASLFCSFFQICSLIQLYTTPDQICNSAVSFPFPNKVADDLTVFCLCQQFSCNLRCLFQTISKTSLCLFGKMYMATSVFLVVFECQGIVFTFIMVFNCSLQQRLYSWDTHGAQRINLADSSDTTSRSKFSGIL